MKDEGPKVFTMQRTAEFDADMKAAEKITGITSQADLIRYAVRQVCRAGKAAGHT